MRANSTSAAPSSPRPRRRSPVRSVSRPVVLPCASCFAPGASTNGGVRPEQVSATSGLGTMARAGAFARGPDGLVTPSRAACGVRRGPRRPRAAVVGGQVVDRDGEGGRPVRALRRWCPGRWAGAARRRGPRASPSDERRAAPRRAAGGRRRPRRRPVRRRRARRGARGGRARSAVASGGVGRPSAASSASSAPVHTPASVGRSWVVTIASALRRVALGRLVLEPHDAGGQHRRVGRARRGAPARRCRGPRRRPRRRPGRSRGPGPRAARGRRSARRRRRPARRPSGTQNSRVRPITWSTRRPPPPAIAARSSSASGR